ncbi:MAG: family N-acetyltransferase [Paenibacillus sp.]|jgi:predicted N-acetyltransferase YhbS|nr:family N-acetyltransferase [Paenibacillus sp.]
MESVQVRRLKHEDMPEAVRLANSVFRDEEQTSMDEAFRQSFSGDLAQSFGAYTGGELVSFMGLVPAVIRIGPASVCTYLLGQVCTREDARGNGYAGMVMKAVMAHIDQAGAALLLVSGSRSLYERFGCLNFGSMVQTSIDREWALARAAVREEGLRIRWLQGHDWFELKRLADAREHRFEYSLWDLADLIGAQSRASCMKHIHHVLVAERDGDGADGRLAAFLVYTVPEEGRLPKRKRIPQAVEWAGEPQAVAQLFAQAMLEHGFEALHVPIPEHEKPLVEHMNGASQEVQPYPATLHIVEPERLLRQVEPYVRMVTGDGLPEDFHAARGEDYSVRLGGRGLEYTLSAGEFIDMLFTPSAVSHPAAAIFVGGERARLSLPLPSPHGLLYV